MKYRKLLAVAAMAGGFSGLLSLSGAAAAETVATDDGIAVKQSEVATPMRGMTMQQVASKFGEPVSKLPGVGKPSISRWQYPGFMVYFEADHVIHSVVADTDAENAGAASAAG